MVRYRLRRAGLEDLETLVLHRHRMWEDLARVEPDLAAITPARLDATDGRYRRWLRARLRNGRVCGFLVEHDRGGPVASGLVWLREDLPRPHRPFERAPYIFSVYTATDHRRRGAAARITAALLAWAETRGFNRARLNASKYGRPMYLALGFAPGSEMQIDLHPGRKGVGQELVRPPTGRPRTAVPRRNSEPLRGGAIYTRPGRGGLTPRRATVPRREPVRERPGSGRRRRPRRKRGS